MFFLGEARYTSGDFLLCPIREHARHHWKQCIAPRIDQKSVTRPLRSQSPNRVGSSPLGPPISSAAARLSSVGIDLLSSAARTSSIVTSSNGLATCGGFMRGLSLAGGAAAGTSEHIRHTLVVSPHRARGICATLMKSILLCTLRHEISDADCDFHVFDSKRRAIKSGKRPSRRGSRKFCVFTV